MSKGGPRLGPLPPGKRSRHRLPCAVLTQPRRPPVRAISEIQLPDSELCRASIEYARAVSEPFLFHHVMRSAIYADLIGRARRLQYDREVLCVSAVLHDLGLTRVAPVDARFEVEGADAAKAF